MEEYWRRKEGWEGQGRKGGEGCKYKKGVGSGRGEGNRQDEGKGKIRKNEILVQRCGKCERRKRNRRINFEENDEREREEGRIRKGRGQMEISERTRRERLGSVESRRKSEGKRKEDKMEERKQRVAIDFRRSSMREAWASQYPRRAYSLWHRILPGNASRGI